MDKPEEGHGLSCRNIVLRERKPVANVHQDAKKDRGEQVSGWT